MKTAITPTRDEGYAQWYQQVIKAAELAEISPVRGCMVIKPWGYAIWDNLREIFDREFKATGHQNIYCPLFIPLSFLEKEADHVSGFAKECAVVTHRRLITNKEGRLVPDGELEEPLIVRPTSEAIIGEMFSRWVHSYRDLPILVNQWANIVRWEMRTRMFLRTTEFLWQEGHTAHATQAEAEWEAAQMLDIYAKVVEQEMAIPVVKGRKSESEKFPGAEITYCIEAMMQDGRALQAGTSHYLGQNFAKAFSIKFTNQAGVEEHVHTTSWGVSTRLIGGLIMAHSDDDGLVLPPRIAPAHVVLMPTAHGCDGTELLAYCEAVKTQLSKIAYHHKMLQVEIDKRELNPGEKSWQWYSRGVPIRIEVGPRELAEGKLFVGRRDKPYRERSAMSVADFAENIVAILDEMQQGYYDKALKFQKANSFTANSKDDFYAYFTKAESNPGMIQAGFVYAYWNGDETIEKQIKEDLKVTVRCLPLAHADARGKCIFSGDPEAKLAVFDKAY